MRGAVLAASALIGVGLMSSLPGCGRSDAGGGKQGGTPGVQALQPLDLVSECTIVLGEAEDAQFTPMFQLGQETKLHPEESQNPSKGKYLEIPDGKGKGVGQAVCKFTVDKPAEYAFWARVWFLDGCGNSFGIEVDGYKIKQKIEDEKTKTVQEILAPPNIEDGTYKHWHWVRLVGSDNKSIRFDLARGEHTLIIHNTEDGPKIDQFLFTTELDHDKWYPAGIMTDN